MDPGRHPIVSLVKFPVEWHQNYFWGPIFDVSYDHFTKYAKLIEGVNQILKILTWLLTTLQVWTPVCQIDGRCIKKRTKSIKIY